MFFHLPFALVELTGKKKVLKKCYVCPHRKRKTDDVDGASKKQKTEEDDKKKKLEEQLKVLFNITSHVLE